MQVCQRLLAGLSEMQGFAWRWQSPGSAAAAPPPLTAFVQNPNPASVLSSPPRSNGVSEFHVCVLRNCDMCDVARLAATTSLHVTEAHLMRVPATHVLLRRAPFKRGRRHWSEQETLYQSQIKCSSQSLSQQTLLSLAPGRRVLCLRVSLWMPRRSRTTQAVSFGRSLPASRRIVF